MSKEIVVREPAPFSGAIPKLAPTIVSTAGRKATRRFYEFFTATIRNKNTRVAYYHAVSDFFAWCDDHGFELIEIEPIVVAAYIEYLGTIYSKPTVKQHLAAIRMCFDWLVTGQIIPMNPASSVRGPTHVVKKGKTPVLTADEARQLLDSIDTATLVGLRDRALIAVMVFSFARVSAVAGMRVQDYYQNGKRCWIRLHEKGGKFHEVPAHHNAELRTPCTNRCWMVWSCKNCGRAKGLTSSTTFLSIPISHGGHAGNRISVASLICCIWDTSTKFFLERKSPNDCPGSCGNGASNSNGERQSPSSRASRETASRQHASALAPANSSGYVLSSCKKTVGPAVEGLGVVRRPAQPALREECWLLSGAIVILNGQPPLSPNTAVMAEEVSAEPFIQTASLSRQYRVGPSTVHALEEVDLEIERGQMLGILGGSGSGKSTLLHLLGGLDSPTAGSVMVEGRDLGGMSGKQRAIYRRQAVGFLGTTSGGAACPVPSGGE